MSVFRKSWLIVALVVLVDQVSKIWVKTSMYLGESHKVFGDWFLIYFTENNGMAFGFEFGGDIGKLLLSVFRVLAILAITYYLYLNIRKGTHFGLIVSLSLILGGAIGNMIDGMFYGLIFNESGYWPAEVSVFLPEEGGYAPFLFGRVVDMLYFPLITTVLPNWVPFWGGESFIFFRPVFNIADSCITVGVFIIFIFQKKFFKESL